MSEPFLIFLLVLGIMFAVARQQMKKAKANMAALSAQLGLELVGASGWVKLGRLQGQFAGRTMEVFNHSTGSGKNRRSWAAVSVPVNAPASLVFTISRRIPLLDAIAKRFRKNEVATNDLPFDKDWALTSNQPDIILAALLPELRQKFVRVAGEKLYTGQLKLSEGKLQYEEEGSIGNTGTATRLGEMAPVLCEIADAVEIGSQLSR